MKKLDEFITKFEQNRNVSSHDIIENKVCPTFSSKAQTDEKKIAPDRVASA